MFIDISRIDEKNISKEINSNIKFQNLSFQNREIKIPETLSIKLKIYKTKKHMIFDGYLKGNIILECSRCLNEFPYKIKIKINQEVKLDKIDDLKIFDLSELIESDIFLAIPIKPLCDEKCDGICPQCGKNLNENECGCSNESIDPRLEKLQDFYQD